MTMGDHVGTQLDEVASTLAWCWFVYDHDVRDAFLIHFVDFFSHSVTIEMFVLCLRWKI